MVKYILKYDKVPANPPLVFAERKLEEAKGSTEITSIGGGSTIDVGKYIAWKLKIPHTAVPTTAGTGSEVTKFAVLTDRGKRVSLEDNELIPDNYILNASNIVNLSPKQTASTGLDALSQGIESFWSPKANDESRHWARLAIRFASKNLLDSYLNPKSELLRMRMLQAANYSGRAINITKTSVCHAISYPLTYHYNIPHGIACAATLPFFMDYFGFNIINWFQVRKLIRLLDIEIKQEIDIDLVAREAMESERIKNTPYKITKELILQTLANLLPNDGGHPTSGAHQVPGMAEGLSEAGTSVNNNRVANGQSTEGI